MFRLKRKHSHSSSSSSSSSQHKNNIYKENRHCTTEITAAIYSIIAIILVKLEIYIIKLLSFLIPPSTTNNSNDGESVSFFKHYHPFNVIRKMLCWLPLKILSMLHIIARSLDIEDLLHFKKTQQDDDDDNDDDKGIKEEKKQRSDKLKLYNNYSMTPDSGTSILGLRKQFPQLTKEEEIHLKKLLDFVNYEPR